MAPTLPYLLKAHAVLVLFAAAYYGLLRRLTFFSLNRAYLGLALLFAAVYPALPVPTLLPAEALAPLPAAWRLAVGVGGSAGRPAPGVVLDWQVVGLAVYAGGAGLFLLRLLGQLLSLAWLRVRARPATVLGKPVRLLAGPAAPFSFGRAIYLSEGLLTNMDELVVVLRHEQAHVRQWHTLDVLLAQVALALAWLNPAAWLLRRAVLDNLEYLADRAALRTGLDRRAYQYSLLHQQPGRVPAPALALHFSFLTLKNRILMLNQPASTTRQLGRYLLAAPLVVALALGYSGARAQAAPTTITLDGPAPKGPAPVYYIDGKRVELLNANLSSLNPNDIATINILKDAKARQLDPTVGERGIVLITTKARLTAPDVVAFNKKVEAIAPSYTEEPAEINAIVPKALAYITKNYPNSRLIGVTKFTRLSDKQVKYRVQLAEGRRPHYVFFTPEGDFIAAR